MFKFTEYVAVCRRDYIECNICIRVDRYICVNIYQIKGKQNNMYIMQYSISFDTKFRKIILKTW